MRLCLNDSGLGVSRNIKPEDAKYVYDLGFRVAGVGIGREVTDDDIKR